MLTPGDESSMEEFLDNSNDAVHKVPNDLLELSLDDQKSDSKPTHTETTAANVDVAITPASIPLETDAKHVTTDGEQKAAVTRDWNTFIGEKSVVFQKSIEKVVEVSAVTRDKIVEASSNLAKSTETARANLSKSISAMSIIAAEKAGLLVGKNYVDFVKDEGCHEITVVAGKVENIPFVVPKNTAIAWKLMVKGFDVGVVVKIREQADGGSIERDLEPFWKISQDELFMGGRRSVDFDRHFILVFDNSYSKLRSKTVAYQVLTGDIATVALEQAEFTAKNKAEEEAAAAAAAEEAAKNNPAGTNTTASPAAVLKSANATVRYVTEGLTPIVSSVIIKVQNASTVISTQAKTNLETIQTSKAWTDTTQYLSSWMSPKPAVKTDDAVSKDDAVNSNEALSPDNKPSNNNEKQASLDAEPK